VTLDNSNFDLSKFSISRSEIPVPIFFPIYLSKFTLDLSNFGSLEVILGPVKEISLFFTLDLSKWLFTPLLMCPITYLVRIIMPAASEAIVIKCLSGDSWVHNWFVFTLLCWIKLACDWTHFHNLFWLDFGRVILRRELHVTVSNIGREPYCN
jgi:hypothetical protein